ncbi:MAG: hypothetical protein OXU20_03715, partial [Myxococcales bacterium]|nr:hypothetical protein [Myxococcales bacterium]
RARTLDWSRTSDSCYVTTSPHPSPTRVMIVQAIEFTGISVKEENTRRITTKAKALWARAVVRARASW